MTDDAPAAANGANQQITWQFGINAEGTSVRIAIPIGEGVMTADVLPSDFATIHATMGQIVDHLRLMGTLPKVASAVPRGVTKWMIGTSNDPKFSKYTIFNVDDGLPTAVMLVLADLDALAVADAIEQKVFAGLSETDKMKMIETVQGGTGRKPNGGLILPGKLRPH